MHEALEITDLTKFFTPHSNKISFFKSKNALKKQVLSHIHLSVMSGEVLALLGPNGAGKTTLLKTIAGFLLQDSGMIKAFGQDIRTSPHFVSFAVGEERSFYWRLTGRENLDFFGALFNLTKKEIRRRTDAACDLFDIHYLDQRYQEYSTGMKQRLALARSYLSDAKIILMDEPTRSLDLLSAKRLRGAIRHFASEYHRAVLFSTHHAEEAEAIADRIAILNDGVLIACGELASLRRQIGNPTSSLKDLFEILIAEKLELVHG